MARRGGDRFFLKKQALTMTFFKLVQSKRPNIWKERGVVVVFGGAERG